MTGSHFNACGGKSCTGLVAVLLMLAWQSEGQVASLAQSKESSTNAFSMVVKVVDAVSGKPLENSFVTVPQLMPPPGVSTTNQWRFMTDASGAAIVSMPAGTAALN